jgi:competence protein ComEA
MVILAVGIWWWWQGRPRETVNAPVVRATGAPLTGADGSPAAGTAAGSTAPGDTATGGAPDRLVVHVIGQVTRPGVVRLPRGSRVLDAVRAAGGVLAGGRLGPVNLARPLVDGEQIVIGPRARGAPPPAPSSGAQPAVVDLNRATAAEFEALPGVGPVLAGRIIEWRTTHGAFTDVAELREVSGIGDAVFARIAPHVRV